MEVGEKAKIEEEAKIELEVEIDEKLEPVAPGHQMVSSSLALLLVHPLSLIFLVIFVAAGQRPR